MALTALADQYKILFVDDETLFLKSIKRYFEDIFDCDYAQSATEALVYLNTTQHYNVIVSDMNMPEMCGVELLEHCKLNYPSTLRILFTGNTDYEAVEKITEYSEPYKILFKSFEMIELRAVLTKALNMENK